MNIALIGMMGSGKSTAGKKLNDLLKDFSFVDTDEKIVTKENKSVNDIFKDFGEPYFRDLETEVLKDILKNDGQIIATGGGIIKSDENIRLLKEKSFVIYLKADARTLFERVKNNKERPLLSVEDVKLKINALLKERETRYKGAANKIINTNDKTSDETVTEIIDFLSGLKI